MYQLKSFPKIQRAFAKQTTYMFGKSSLTHCLQTVPVVYQQASP